MFNNWRSKDFQVSLKREFRIKKPILWMKFHRWLPDFFCVYVLTGEFAYVRFTSAQKPVFSDRGSHPDLFSFRAFFLRQSKSSMIRNRFTLRLTRILGRLQNFKWGRYWLRNCLNSWSIPKVWPSFINIYFRIHNSFNALAGSRS